MKAKRKLRDHAAEWDKRKALVEIYRSAINRGLGKRCQWKGGCKETEGLEYNHTEGRTWEPSKCNMVQRMRLYYLDFKAGKLSRLCKPHNLQDARERANPVSGGKPSAPKSSEVKRAVRDLPKAMRPGPVRRRILARVTKAAKRGKAAARSRRKGRR